MGLLDTLRFIVHHPLNQGHPGRAVGRFVAWQIRSRIFPGPVIVPFVNGAVLSVERGMHGATQNIYCGLHDFEMMSFLLHLLRPEDTFVDIGANVGSYTILASAAVGARTEAFEPNPESYRYLAKNIDVNRIQERVNAHMAGAGAEPGTLRFAAAGTGTHVSRNTNNGEPCFEAPILTLDDCLWGVHPVAIKIDVEGFECAVFAGADRILKDSSLWVVITEENSESQQFGYSVDQARKTLLNYGFTRAVYDPFTRQLLADHEEQPSGTALYIRNPTALQERLSSAPAFQVKGHSL